MAVTVTVTSPASVLILAQCDVERPAASAVWVGQVSWNGGNVSPALAFQASTAARQTVHGSVAVASVPAGTHTARLRSSFATANAAFMRMCALTVIVFPQPSS
jgi:hypothetical protein